MATMKVSPLSRAGVALPARASRTSVRVMAAKKGAWPELRNSDLSALGGDRSETRAGASRSQ